MSREFDIEEHFHSQDRKESRRQRKQLQQKDQSKFKKTEKKEEENKIDFTLKQGKVVSITGEGAFVDIDGVKVLCSIKGFLKKDKNQLKNILAVGDIVRVTDHLSIQSIEPRYSILSRTDISGNKEQLIAVNVDQAIITVSVVNPPLKPALIDRYLIALEKGNIQPIIVVNKIDLLDEATQEEKDQYREFLESYEKLGIVICSISTKEKIGIDALKSLLKNKTSVFSGQSGVGKSSLLNAAFGLTLKTGDLAHKTSKGTHTTTTSELLSLPGGGYCVDTPGIRSFGIWDLQEAQIHAHFHDLTKNPCKFIDCKHMNEPGCTVLEGLKNGEISQLRYNSYKTLLDEVQKGLDNRTKRKQNYESD